MSSRLNASRQYKRELSSMQGEKMVTVDVSKQVGMSWNVYPFHGKKNREW